MGVRRGTLSEQVADGPAHQRDGERRAHDVQGMATLGHFGFTLGHFGFRQFPFGSDSGASGHFGSVRSE
eukprot:2150846-Pyramimonas_sp.AAC.2